MIVTIICGRVILMPFLLPLIVVIEACPGQAAAYRGYLGAVCFIGVA